MASPKLNFIHVCDSAFISQQGNLNIIGIFENILVAKFPAIHPRITIVFNVAGNNGTHEFLLQIKDEKNHGIGPEIKGNFQLDGNKQTFGFIGTIGNIKFEHEGIYYVDITVDGKDLGGTGFKVSKLGIS